MSQTTATVSSSTPAKLTKKASRKRVAPAKTKAESKAPKRVKKEATLVPCACGCGALVPRSYQQGHDARHKGQLLDIATGQAVKTPLRTPDELEKLGYTAQMIKERHIVTTNMTPKIARAAISALGWSHFLDQREAKLEAKAGKKKPAKVTKKK